MRLEIDVYEDSEGIWGYRLYKIGDISFSDIKPGVSLKRILTEVHGFDHSQACIDSAHAWLRVTDLAVGSGSGSMDVSESEFSERLAVQSVISSQKELEMRLVAQGELGLWNNLASIWHVSDDDCPQYIVGDYAGILQLDEEDRLYLLAEYPELSDIIDAGLYYLSSFQIYVQDRIYCLVVVRNSRCVVCVPRHPK